MLYADARPLEGVSIEEFVELGNGDHAPTRLMSVKSRVSLLFQKSYHCGQIWISDTINAVQDYSSCIDNVRSGASASQSRLGDLDIIRERCGCITLAATWIEEADALSFKGSFDEPVMVDTRRAKSHEQIYRTYRDTTFLRKLLRRPPKQSSSS